MTEGVSERSSVWERLSCWRLARLCRTRARRKVAPDPPADKTARRRGRRRLADPPSAQYSALGEKLRLAAPAALQCALFCGGARCRYERPHPSAAALQGFYSDWVTEDIVAMARPSTAALAARNLLQQFHCWGIRSVVNLQTAGEHASCGPPLTASGFTYDPRVFMADDIYYYNFAWPDYGEATLSSLLDMAKVLSFAVQQGRVAIHCHAGLGRTGVLIACYLVYSMRMRANDAIRLVRRRRPRAVQTRGQIRCVQQFECYLLPQTVVFSTRDHTSVRRDRRTAEFTLRQFLHRQRICLHGLEERNFKELPKIVYVIVERLLQLCGCQRSSGLDMGLRHRPFYKSFLVYYLKQARPPDPDTPEEIAQVTAASLPMIEWRDPLEEDVERNLESVSRITGGCGGAIPAVRVYEAFVCDHQSLPSEQQRHLKQLRGDIDHRREAMARIDEEDNPEILTGLLFEWLEGLKTPVLGTEDLATIISRSHRVDSCVPAMKMEDVILIEYLLRFVIRLRPLAANKKIDIIKRLIASLAQQTVVIQGEPLPNKSFTRLREGTCAQVVNFMLRMILQIQKEAIKPGSDDRDVILPHRSKIKALQ
ncbi:uncharacterized protein LOC121730577 isoform X2 [Aricia agestis]|uniref:uncharacterized protein LOC121730577 isoform X2 n=1 Tax=Aricia agestis TaxID=91739 RepID=UPI001C20C09C|nr:uncharacterized protein LOC121730577 isoform X2 [Aricia agestis]